MSRVPRLLLLLLCCILPLQSLQAEAGLLASLDEAHAQHTHAHAHVPHHHHVDVIQHLVPDGGDAASDDATHDHLSDHCVCPMGGLLPTTTWVVHRVAARQALPEWTPRPLPAPVLPGLQRPPHAAG